MTYLLLKCNLHFCYLVSVSDVISECANKLKNKKTTTEKPPARSRTLAILSRKQALAYDRLR